MRFWVTAVLVAVTACTSAPLPPENPLETDAIKDAATAIQTGQEACLAAWALPQARKDPDWHTRFHSRVWRVWFGDERCQGFGSDLDAATGKKIGDCSICVA